MMNTGALAAHGDNLRRADVALRDALARAEAALQEKDLDRFFAASVETSMWIVAVDDFILRDDPSYEVRRDADPGGRVVRGLKWGRNCGVHKLIALQDVRHFFHRSRPLVEGPLAGTPVAEPFTLHLFWKAPDGAKPVATKGGNEAAYDANVAGKSVRETLNTASDFLFHRAYP